MPIDDARCGHDDWWWALEWLRDGLLASGMLREVEVKAVMPKVRPWLPVSCVLPLPSPSS